MQSGVNSAKDRLRCLRWVIYFSFCTADVTQIQWNPSLVCNTCVEDSNTLHGHTNSASVMALITAVWGHDCAETCTFWTNRYLQKQRHFYLNTKIASRTSRRMLCCYLAMPFWLTNKCGCCSTDLAYFCYNLLLPLSAAVRKYLLNMYRRPCKEAFYMKPALFYDFRRRRVVIPYRRFGTSCLSYLQRSGVQIINVHLMQPVVASVETVWLGCL